MTLIVDSTCSLFLCFSVYCRLSALTTGRRSEDIKFEVIIPIVLRSVEAHGNGAHLHYIEAHILKRFFVFLQSDVMCLWRTLTDTERGSFLSVKWPSCTVGDRLVSSHRSAGVSIFVRVSLTEKHMGGPCCCEGADPAVCLVALIMCLWEMSPQAITYSCFHMEITHTFITTITESLLTHQGDGRLVC